MTCLDYNATSPTHPKVIEAVTAGLKLYGNPSSIHAYGREARKYVEAAREKIADYMGVAARNVVFTASGTEGNHYVLRGMPQRRLFISAVEHDCTFAAAKARGDDFGILPVDKNGIVMLNDCYPLPLRGRARAGVDSQSMGVNSQNPHPDLPPKGEGESLFSIMIANNETGIIQDIPTLAAKIRGQNGLLHVDAVQALGKIPFGSWTYAADLITISPHKAGGAKGCAAVIVKDGIEIQPLLTGGGQERGHRAGTENVAGIMGFAALLDVLNENKHQAQQWQEWQIWFETELAAIFGDRIHIVGQNTPRLPNTSCVLFKNADASKLLIMLDLYKVCVSSGSACSSGKVKKSHVLEAMSYHDEWSNGALRFSWGWNTTKEDLEKTLGVLEKLKDKIC